MALVWAAVVFVFAVLPTHETLNATVGEGETLATQVGHFVEFAVLAALVALWLAGPSAGRAAVSRRVAFVAWAAALAYGVLIEVVQIPLSYRDGQVSDVAIDAAGALAGLLVFSRLLSRRPEGRWPVR